MTVVDCQSHWHPREYFEWLCRRKDYPRAQPSGDGGYLAELDPNTTFPVMPLLVDLDRQVEELQAAGVGVIVSSTGSFGVEDLPAGEAVELAELVNEATAAAQRARPGSWYGLARIPLQDPDAALPVLNRAVNELGLRGVCLPSNVGKQSIAQDRFRPVYARIEELGVPIFLHPTRSLLESTLHRYGLEHIVSFMFDTSIAALDLIFSGIMRDHPRLAIVHPHVGGTLPYLAGRVDFEYTKPWALDTQLDEPPSATLRRFHTDTVCQNPAALRLALDFYGPERVLFSSDYPYWYPDAELKLVRETVAEGDLAAVLGGNARRLLGLPGGT